MNLPSGFVAKVNTSGTHITKDVLKIRVNIYPPKGSKTYPLHYVDHFDREPTEEELADPAKLALIPTHKELNPCLCQFIKISPEITKQQLEDIVRETFDVSTLLQLDNSLSGFSTEKVPDIMRFKGGAGRKLSKAENTPLFIAMMNTRFGDM